mmetsp:Transcript_10855/g.17914  ORF Transcript_10855/g.17914 Transcript_10855/m.17914 type:complete len:465 (+) Transcript_10855:63-1457(+)
MATDIEEEKIEEPLHEQVDEFKSTMTALMEDVWQLQVEASEFEARLEETVSAATFALRRTREPTVEDAEEEDGNIANSEAVVAEPFELKSHAGSWHHAVAGDWRWLSVAPTKVWHDADVVLKALAQDHRALFNASSELRSNREFVLQAMQLQGLSLEYASEDLRADRQVVETAVQQNRLALRFASQQLRADTKLVELAMRAGDHWVRRGQALRRDAEDLNADRAAARQAVHMMDPEYWNRKIRRDWRQLQVAPTPVKDDRDLVLEILRDSWGHALQYASQAIQNDREVVLQAVQFDGAALQYASDELRSDTEVVLFACKQTWKALAFASDAARADRTIVQAGMLQHHEALRYASPELCDDRDLILQAVSLHGHSLKYASNTLQADRTIVFHAVKQNWQALRYASEDLRTDAEICLMAVSPSSCYRSKLWQLEGRERPSKEESVFVEKVPFEAQSLNLIVNEPEI